MPVTIRKVRDGCYEVRTPNQVHAKCTTLEKAQAQKRIIEEEEGKKRGKLGRMAHLSK